MNESGPGNLKPASAREAAFGRLTTDRAEYRPLDDVQVTAQRLGRGDSHCVIRAADAEHRTYFQQRLAFDESGVASTRFTAGGGAGCHYLFLQFEGATRHSRYCNFRVLPTTTGHSGDAALDSIYPFMTSHMPLGRRVYQTAQGPLLGYISGDTYHFDGIWMRDCVYGMPAFRHWESDLHRVMQPFLDVTSSSGHVPDGLERDGSTWRVGMESDVEYILVLGAFDAWMVSGDDDWLARTLPVLQAAVERFLADPRRWDTTLGLARRQHSCDTWDFDIDGVDTEGNCRHVASLCDQTGYVAAFEALAMMSAARGDHGDADRWRQRADDLRRQATTHLWDGEKFQHHLHLEAIDHGPFDESRQLAMSNTWAITRGLTTDEQARAIVRTYRDRHQQTGDAYPWWSLQPGYPNELGYFSRRPYLSCGGYANGGLMPWVGGELCRGAFHCGESEYGVELLRQFARHLEQSGTVHVWYWPDGEPGFRTNNEVPYAGWGMAQWVAALMEGLAGVVPVSPRLRRVICQPRWRHTPCRDVRVCFHWPQTEDYLAYRWTSSDDGREQSLLMTASGSVVGVQLPLPESCPGLRVTCDGQTVPFRIESSADGRVLHVQLPVREPCLLRIEPA